MGTDIYLKWDGQTRTQQKAQYTGYSIDAGNVGYLRASIGMETENAVLREVFPNEIWEKAGKYIPYDFNQGFAVLQAVAKKYLASCLFGIPYTKNAVQIKHEEWAKRALAMLAEKKKFDKVVNPADSMDDLPNAVMWLNSLYNFFWLGMDKQKAKLNPKVMISW